MNTEIWHRIGLEFGDMYFQGTIESELGSQYVEDLSNKSFLVGVGGSLNV